MAILWDIFSTQYLAARRTSVYNTVKEQLQSSIVPHLSDLTPQDITWLTGALADEHRKWFVAFVCRLAPTLPEPLFAPLIRAAVDERNPSFNRQFVEPCLTNFGVRRVISALLDILETGSNAEKAGAANALYWANVLRSYDARSDDQNQPVAHLQESDDALADIWLRQRCLVLQEFVSNPNVDVRRSLISKVNLNPDAYPDNLKPLVGEVIQIARSHTDEYIRHRIEVELGNTQLFRPLPERE